MRNPTQPFIVLAALSLAAPASTQQVNALLHAPMVELPVDSAPFQELLDIDGDGDLDVVGTRVHENGSNNQVVVWRNDQGVFTIAWQGQAAIGGMTALQQRSLAVAAADFNGDGLQDFVLAQGNTAEQFVSQPNFTFQRTAYVSPQGTKHVATGDFDGDGNPDFATVGMSGTLATVKVFLAAGTEASISAPQTGPFGIYPTVRVAAVELDGVPGDEILLSNRSTNIAREFRVSAGQLVHQQMLTSSLLSPNGSAWLWMGGDLDGDGDADVVVFRPDLGTSGIPRYEVFRRTGPASFVPEPEAVGGPAEYLADIDGDGDLDGVCCGGGGPTYSWPKLDFASTFEISSNLGGGAFARSWKFAGAGSESMAGAADIDGDGDIDFVAGRCVFHGRGPWIEHPLPVAGGSGVMVVGRPWDLRDIDRDGDLDFFTSRNRGDGVMTLVNDYVAPPPGKQFAGSIAIDVDGDGAQDRIVRQQVLGQFEVMVLIQNNGGGHYHYAGPCAPPGLRFGAQYAYSADHYLAADCDGDGDEDVIANSNPAADFGYFAQIFWNDNGQFSAGPSFSPGTGGRINRVADFDADGHPDLLMSNGAALQVARGTGVPSAPFAIVWTVPDVPFEPAALVIADLDDDGRLDFAAPQANGDVALYINITQGLVWGFQDYPLPGVKMVLAPYQTPAALRATLAAADFDGDGKTDLAVGRFAGEVNVGLVLRRTGWSSPPGLADYEVRRQCFVDGFAGDADGDGDADLVGERVTFSPRFHGAAAGRRLQLHAGVPGEIGAVPLLGATGPFRCGEIEVLRLVGVPGPTLAVLGISLGTAELVNVPLPGLTLRLDPLLMISGEWPIVENGLGRAAAKTTLPIWLPNGLQGFEFFSQAFVLDLAAPTFITQSNVLAKRIGS